MRKPSIFSRDYEIRMRKRRRRIVMFSSIVVLIIALGGTTMAVKHINFSVLRDDIQKWIDEDDKSKNENVAMENKTQSTEEKSETTEKKEQVEQQKPKEAQPKIIEINVGNSTLKIDAEEKDGKVKFKNVKDKIDGIYYTFNKDMNLILTIDKNQDMKVFDVDKKEVNITAANYIAPNKEVFKKNVVLQTYKEYIWNSEAKFIDNTKVAYISNVPYFGYGLNKYIWVVDLKNNTHTTLWNSKAKEIKIGDLKEKGLEVVINGNVKYVNTNGQLTN